MDRPIVVIGVGNAYRQDDAVGIEVVHRLRRLALPPAVVTAVSDGEPASLVELWCQADLAIVVDALSRRSATPGAIHRLSLDAVGDAVERRTSSHGLGLGAAVRLARELDRMPGRLIVYAVEISEYSFGSGISKAVSEAATHVVGHIAEDVAAFAAAGRPLTA